jgi:hypothetical protein
LRALISDKTRSLLEGLVGQYSLVVEVRDGLLVGTNQSSIDVSMVFDIRVFSCFLLLPLVPVKTQRTRAQTTQPTIESYFNLDPQANGRIATIETSPALQRGAWNLCSCVKPSIAVECQGFPHPFTRLLKLVRMDD